MRYLCILFMAGFVAACAKTADQIAASYVSPYQFEHFTCRQLADEGQRVSARAHQLAGIQNEKATGDAVAMTVGLIIVWPALFLIKGNDQQTAELARMRGEMEAIEQVSIRKQCAITFREAKVQ